MKTTKCLNCEKLVAQKKGKRAKLYCNDLCRATYHQKKKEPVLQDFEKKLMDIISENDTTDNRRLMVDSILGIGVVITKTEENGKFRVLDPQTDEWWKMYADMKPVVTENGKPMFYESKTTEETISAGTSAVAGKTVTVTLPSSALNDAYKSNQQLITQYEEELTRLGTSQIAKERGKWLTKRIYELKYPNKND